MFTFTNTPQPSTVVLLGFELYYKLYDNSSTTALQTYQSEEDKINNLSNAGISDITQIGYKPLYALPSAYTQGDTIPTRQPPLIPISDPTVAATTFSVTIPFNTAATGTSAPPSQNFFPGVFVGNSSTPTVQIARYLPNPNNSSAYILKGFGSGDFAATDGTQNGGDVPDTAIAAISPGVPQSLLVGIYAVAYGRLPDFSNTLYSTPVPLGTIELSNVTFTP